MCVAWVYTMSPCVAARGCVHGTSNSRGTITHDAGLYQNVPYWLNGWVPLAYQLKAAGIEELTPDIGACDTKSKPTNQTGFAPAIPVGPVRPLDQVKTFVAGILGRVGADGWVGPPVSASPIQPTQTCAPNVNLYGGDLISGSATPLPKGSESAACKSMCLAHDNCTAYVYERCGTDHSGPATGANAESEPSAETDLCWLKKGGWDTQVYKPAKGCSLCSQVLKAVPAKGNGDMYWGPTDAMFALIQYAEAERSANPEIFVNVSAVVLNHFLAQAKLMEATPLSSWAQQRWIDMALSVAWLVDNEIGTVAQQASLVVLGSTLHTQGTDWDTWWVQLQFRITVSILCVEY